MELTPKRGKISPSDVVVIVMGGGRGTRLYPLTRDRAKPAVSFGGKYRLIDIPLTNCLNSDFHQIYILTQFNSFSLNRHIWQTYSREVTRDGFIDVLAAEQTMDNRTWFQGTADAVRKSLRHTLVHEPRYVLILSGDQIYSMNYLELLEWHARHEADVTIAAHFSAPAELASLGVVDISPEMRVTRFCEKPDTVDVVEDFRLDRKPGLRFPPGKPFLGSMGIYLFSTEALVKALDNDEEDFGKSVIPQCAGGMCMSCFPFDGYWKDVGTIRAFYDANMDWRENRGIAELFQDGNVMITHARHLSPTRIDSTQVTSSIIADGCHLQAKRVARSIIGVRGRVGAGSEIEDSIILGNSASARIDQFEIGRNCRICHAIIDKNVVIGDGARIENVGGIRRADRQHYAISSGIIVIPRDTVLPPGTVI